MSESRRESTVIPTVALAAACTFLLLSLAGCAQQPEQEAAAPPEAEPRAAADDQPRVFFIEPQDGASLQSPVHMVFGAENFEIRPVDDGAAPPDAEDERVGHLHIGVDTECLPPGVVIPQASPWVHFGDGQTEFDLQLPPGQYTLCLQAADDEHRTYTSPGLSQQITITVTEDTQG